MCMQIEKYFHEGTFESREKAWSAALINEVDRRYAKIIAKREYVPPTEEEKKLGFCSSMNTAVQIVQVRQVCNVPLGLVMCRAELKYLVQYRTTRSRYSIGW